MFRAELEFAPLMRPSAPKAIENSSWAVAGCHRGRPREPDVFLGAHYTLDLRHTARMATKFLNSVESSQPGRGRLVAMGVLLQLR